MIDTHCHLTYDPLAEQLDQVLSRAAEAGVQQMITVGTSPDDGRKAAGLAARFPQIFATVGVHPHYAAQWSDQALVRLVMHELVADPKVVALGEMGLDRHYAEPSIEEQKRMFSWQLGIAGELAGKPIIIHNRLATEEVAAMIRDSGIPGGRFVFHCFTGNDAELDVILGLGAMVSFTGIVTFKNSQTLAASALRVPLDRLMIETDAPYLTPAPYRKIKVNEPFYVQYTARFLAAQRGMSEMEFIAAMDANAQRFFRLPAA